MYGAIIGDIIGSRFEFDRGNKSKEFELFSKECEFTDDTVMTIAVAEALMEAGPDADEETIKDLLIKSLKKWGKKYPDAGYGARFIDWVLSEDSEPYGSYGNGSGMRVSPAGWLYDSLDRTREVARWTAEITHNHPEGIKGAESVAAAIFMARHGASKDEIQDYIESEFGYDLSRTLDDTRPGYYHVEDCMRTMPEAFECFLESESYEDCVRNVMYIGGDTDTLAAIAGAIAEAFWGLPMSLIIKSKEYLPEDIDEVVNRFNEVVHGTEMDPDDTTGYENNKYIKMAAERVINTNDVEDKIMLLRVIRKRIAEEGEAPMPMIDVNNTFGCISLDDIKMGQDFTLGQEVRLRMDTVKDEDGNEWFPLFTDMDELNKQPTANITINTSILVILQNALNSERVQGVAINPFTEKLILSKQMIEIILSEWEEDKENNA